jgi:hypothetical protein
VSRCQNSKPANCTHLLVPVLNATGFSRYSYQALTGSADSFGKVTLRCILTTNGVFQRLSALPQFPFTNFYLTVTARKQKQGGNAFCLVANRGAGFALL